MLLTRYWAPRRKPQLAQICKENWLLFRNREFFFSNFFVKFIFLGYLIIFYGNWIKIFTQLQVSLGWWEESLNYVYAVQFHGGKETIFRRAKMCNFCFSKGMIKNVMVAWGGHQKLGEAGKRCRKLGDN